MEHKIVILQVVGVMNRGGAETMLMDLFRRLHSNFRFIFLVNKKKHTTPKGDFDDDITSIQGEMIYIDSVWDIGIIKYISHFKKIVEQIGKIDIVHSHLNSKGGIISFAARKCGIDYVIVHSHACLKFSGSLSSVIVNCAELYFQRYLINKYATDYWACSEEALESLFNKKNINSDRCLVIKNAIDSEKYLNIDLGKLVDIKKSLNLPCDRLIIGTVGRIAKVKNYDFLIDVLKLLKEKGIQFLFIFVGLKQDKVYSNEVFGKIKEYGMENDVMYLEPRSNLEYIYPLFDLFVAASAREGLGLVSVEAQAAGVPCIISEGFPKCVDMGLSLVSFVKGFDVDEWVDIIVESKDNSRLDDKDKILNAIRNKGYDIVTEAEKVKNLYMKEEK